MKQVTIRATITITTPGIVAALLADPRTGSDNTNEATAPFDESNTAAIATENRNISQAWRRQWHWRPCRPKSRTHDRHAIHADTATAPEGTLTWWVPLLVIIGVWRHARRHWPLTYDPALWSVVFPLGMYSVATLTYGKTTHVGFMEPLARFMFWVAVAPGWRWPRLSSSGWSGTRTTDGGDHPDDRVPLIR
jgi:hypothetical protein